MREIKANRVNEIEMKYKLNFSFPSNCTAPIPVQAHVISIASLWQRVYHLLS